MPARTRFVKEAFFKIANLVLLGIGGAAALAAGSVVFGGIVIGMELGYLTFLSRSLWFRRRVRERKGWGGGLLTVSQREGLASKLDDAPAARYAALRKIYRKIGARVEQDYQDNSLIEAAVQNLETLSDTFLKMLVARQQIEGFLSQADPKTLRGELDRLRAGSADQLEPSEDALTSREAILVDRLESLEKAQAAMGHMRQQLEKIESSFQAAHDKIMSLTGRIELDSQIDLMLTNLEDAKTAVARMESLVLSAEPIDSSLPDALQSRVRSGG